MLAKDRRAGNRSRARLARCDPDGIFRSKNWLASTQFQERDVIDVIQTGLCLVTDRYIDIIADLKLFSGCQRVIHPPADLQRFDTDISRKRSVVLGGGWFVTCPGQAAIERKQDTHLRNIGNPTDSGTDHIFRTERHGIVNHRW